MISEKFKFDIYTDFHSGKPRTNGRKYAYTIEYNSIKPLPWRIIRAALDGSTTWEDVGPVPVYFQCVPAGSKIRLYSAK